MKNQRGRQAPSQRSSAARPPREVTPRWKATMAGGPGEVPTRPGMRAVSQRKRERDAFYAEWRGLVMLENVRKHRGVCRAGVAGVCQGHAVELHHRRKTSDGGDLMSKANVVPICTRCHRWIHASADNELDAASIGLLVTELMAEWDQLGVDR